MFTLNNIATVDTYPAAGGARLPCRGAVKVNIQVANASVFMEATMRQIDGSTAVGSDEFLQPGVYSLARPVDLLRFKSGATGVPARVTVTALTQAEV